MAQTKQMAIPAATSGMTIDDALGVAGVDRAEFALLASTTFSKARSLEELATLIATTKRRGLDGMLRHVYFEQFGGANGPPSLHVGIDGLRAIAHKTGSFGGKQEPRYSGQWEMPLPNSKTKTVPEKAVVTVWRIVQGRSCAFEGVAYMEEFYPGVGGRGDQWRLRPRHMLGITAERHALREAFSAEMSGIGDIDADIEEQSQTTVSEAERTAYMRAYPPDELPEPLIDENHVLAGLWAARVVEADQLDVEHDDLTVEFPIEKERLIRAGEKLRDRIEAAQLASATEAE